MIRLMPAMLVVAGKLSAQGTPEPRAAIGRQLWRM